MGAVINPLLQAEDSFHRLCIANTTSRKKIYIRHCCIDRLSQYDL